jgi:hypothetical protein
MPSNVIALQLTFATCSAIVLLLFDRPDVGPARKYHCLSAHAAVAKTAMPYIDKVDTKGLGYRSTMST